MRVPVNDLSRAIAGCAPALRTAMERVLTGGSFVLGPEVAAFEREFAASCGVEHCVGVASGSDALELALRAIGVAAGDEVVTVANAGMYSTLAILACGAKPVYADVDAGDLTLAPAELTRALNGRTRAIVATHLYGHLADMDGIAAALRGTAVAIVEDGAQAHGAQRHGRAAGSFGAAACFSFYPTKNLGALGDGGAVTTGDARIAARLRQLRQYGWDRKYHVALPGGRNSRLDELQAAVLRVRLPALDTENARRRAVVTAYAQRIRHPRIRVAPAGDASSVAHLAIVRTPARDDLRRHLEALGVGSDVHYPIPDHRQPIMAHRPEISLPVTERACAEVLTLPCFPAMTDAEVTHVIDACNAWPT